MDKKIERLPWLRLWCDFIDDPKVQRLSEVDQRRYLMLLILKRTGELATLRTIDDIAWRIRVTDSDVSMMCRDSVDDVSNMCRAMSKTVETLEARGLICRDNGVFDIPTWDKRQSKNPEATERLREKRAASTKENVGSVDDVSMMCRDSVAPDIDADAEKDTEEMEMERREEPGSIVPPEAGGTRPSSSPKDRCPYQQILDLYHEILPELPRVHVWDGPDRRSMSARWKEDKGRQTLDWWRTYFETVKTCPWLMGKVKDFRADLAWLVRPTNMGNVLNGRYDQRPCSPISRANAATLEAFINAGPGGDVGFGGAGGGDE